MNTTTRKTLVELLAETDALFWPNRRQGDDPTMAQLAARAVYHSKGLPYRKAGDGKARMAILRELEASGIVTVSRWNGRASHWRLTDHADEIARALVGMPGRRECVAALRRIVKLADAGDYLPTTDGNGLRFVRETDLGRFTYAGGVAVYGDKCARLQEALAFAWPRRWATSALCGGYGSRNAPMAHAVTVEGLAALSEPARKIELPKRDAGLADFYAGRFTDHGEGWEVARHKDEFAIWLQHYFSGWRTVSETNSAGTVSAETEKQTKTGSNVGKE